MPHTLLLSKLRAYGMSIKATNFFASYLLNRKQLLGYRILMDSLILVFGACGFKCFGYIAVNFVQVGLIETQRVF